MPVFKKIPAGFSSAALKKGGLRPRGGFDLLLNAPRDMVDPLSCYTCSVEASFLSAHYYYTVFRKKQPLVFSCLFSCLRKSNQFE